MLINKTVGAISLGYLNDTTDFQKPEGCSQSTIRIFQLGKGNIAARSNAITILRNGNTGLGTVNPSKILEVIGVSSATPVTLVIGNKSGFGTASLEFLATTGLPANGGLVKSEATMQAVLQATWHFIQMAPVLAI